MPSQPPYGRSLRSAPGLPADFSRQTPHSANVAQADMIVAGLGDAPAPEKSRRYYAHASDGRRVTVRTNRPLRQVLEALEDKAGMPVTNVTIEGVRRPQPTRGIRPTDHHLALLGLDQLTLRSPTQDAPPPARDVVPAPATFLMPRPATRVYLPDEIMLSDRMARFIQSMEHRDANRSGINDTIYTLRIFYELVGDKPVRELNVADADVFQDALTLWPPNASKRRAFRLMRAPEVLAKAQRIGGARLNLRTRQKHIDRLRAFFRWLELRNEAMPGLLFGVKLYRRNQDLGRHREPFTDDDLRRMFEVLRARKLSTPHMYWAPIIALYNGLRLNEIGQLYVDDIIKLDGHWCFDITRDRPGQRLKNFNSRRALPIHPTILECGFLDFVDQARRWQRNTLFPGLVWGISGPGDTIGDWFNRNFLRKHCGITARSKTFHSFRHCFATLGERSRVTDTRLAIMLGHSAGRSVLRTHYVKHATPGELVHDIRAIRFPELAIDAYRPQDYEDAFRRASIEESRTDRLDRVYGTYHLGRLK
ncbi:site-specific integrase [Xanthomonas sp. NCPPB 2632]|uniref:site-specific integrase n=1 Tax=Xanthomonas sp. NCPPB 2632 TaxID=3240912 RepID=UPI003518F0A5